MTKKEKLMWYKYMEPKIERYNKIQCLKNQIKDLEQIIMQSDQANNYAQIQTLQKELNAILSEEI